MSSEKSQGRAYLLGEMRPESLLDDGGNKTMPGNSFDEISFEQVLSGAGFIGDKIRAKTDGTEPK